MAFPRQRAQSGVQRIVHARHVALQVPTTHAA
jgi:hypothetical protein